MSDAHVAAVRAFQRFYTKRVGALRDGLLDSPFSLTEVRVLYELAHRETPTAATVGKELGLDGGYLSRLLAALERQGLIDRQRSKSDGRQNVLRFTRRGRQAFATLDARANDEVRDLLRGLSPAQHNGLIDAMRTIEGLLGERERKVPYLLRPHRPGDMGWVVHRHGVLYATEHGWDETFEALVASVVASFIQRFDPTAERCWIAERDGDIVGSVFLVRKTKTVAQLRLLLVEPSARGLGIGKRLVDECTMFARTARYRSIVLWTNDVLRAARRVYEAAGYRLVEEEPHHSFGHDLVGQTWELVL